MWTLAELGKGACKMCCCVWRPLLGLWLLRKHCPSRRFSCAGGSGSPARTGCGPGHRVASADRHAQPRHGSSDVARQDLPHCRQPGGVLEQRPQIGDQMCFVCMRDNQNYTSYHWKLVILGSLASPEIWLPLSLLTTGSFFQMGPEMSRLSQPPTLSYF